ncbi:MAG: hypothetical protein CVV44_21560 [Spirochaetae bacterium HGW-Spirochaetae-1]|jgi:hypothetical protein|nr:MAG: hypothetical protein CVV44_21560 [Spirochaetae bacterium HGW-Spirochaetae-1]
MNIKKLLRGIVLFVLIAFAVLIVVSISYYHSHKAALTFILDQAGYFKATDYIQQEISVNIDDTTIPVMFYHHPKVKSDVYYVLIHGFAPQAHKHEKIHLMAASLCDATGVNVFIPYIPSYFKKDRKNFQEINKEIGVIYTTLAQKYPGKYRAFGACLGATFLVSSFRDVPADIMPEKLFLFGPYNDGKELNSFFKDENSSDIDFIVKLVISSNMDIYSEKEKSLIQKAMMSSKPGRTDESKMKQILGAGLFKNISIVQFNPKDFQILDIKQSTALAKFSKTKFHIMHSRNDSIIPFSEGRALSDSLKEKGADVNFLGTELFEHSQNKTTVSGLYNELKYMIYFFDELFAGDVSIK